MTHLSRTLERLSCALVICALAACGSDDSGTVTSIVTPPPPPPPPPPASTVVIKVLSNRADLVSGGDALVEVVLPNALDQVLVKLDVDGRDVTNEFALRENGRYMGLVTGLVDGANVLTAQLPNGHGAHITITNHPIGGPVFSGEQIQPWTCTTDANGLGAPKDAQCNADTKVQWRYRNTAGSYADYDLANPPTDVATTTIDDGRDVPYIFVEETGAINRGIFKLVVLADPAKPIAPWHATTPWNGSLYYKFGASCGTVYSQNAPSESVEDNRPLSKGYAVATSSLSTLGNDCNTVTSSESLMMIKEHLIERFGEIRGHTRSKGGSGGSIGQTVTATGYPGLTNGLNVDLSFEDFWTTLDEVANCHLLVHYFTQVSPNLWEDPAQQSEVTGHASTASCAAWEVSFAPLMDPKRGCGAGTAYDPVSNPGGCRSTVQDMQVGILGRRTEHLTAAEIAAGHGFAKSPLDNTGRLYGLVALRAGQITSEQFVDMNEKIGSLDIDGNYVSGRREADPGAVEIVYRAGLVASGETLKKVPIIDVRAFTGNAEIHTNFHSFSQRERQKNAQNGQHDNHTIWVFTEVPNLPSIIGNQSFADMGEWLRGIDADTSSDPIEVKINRHRPDDAQDSCIHNDQKMDPSECPEYSAYFADPLIASGGPKSNDVLKCTLAPLPDAWPSDGSYGNVPFTPTVGPVLGQWDRLRAALPDGVCDWSKPGVDQVPVQPWTSFAEGPGGKQLPAPPLSVAD